MHEHSFTKEIVESVLSELSAHPKGSPSRVRVSVGEALHLNRESVISHFGALTTGTRLEGVFLDLEETPMLVRCPTCNVKSPVDDHHCPVCCICGSADVEVLSGQGVTVDSIELEVK